MQKGERRGRKKERLPEFMHFWYIAFISCFVPESIMYGIICNNFMNIETVSVNLLALVSVDYFPNLAFYSNY